MRDEQRTYLLSVGKAKKRAKERVVLNLKDDQVIEAEKKKLKRINLFLTVLKLMS